MLHPNCGNCTIKKANGACSNCSLCLSGPHTPRPPGILPGISLRPQNPQPPATTAWSSCRLSLPTAPTSALCSHKLQLTTAHPTSLAPQGYGLASPPAAFPASLQPSFTFIQTHSATPQELVLLHLHKSPSPPLSMLAQQSLAPNMELHLTLASSHVLASLCPTKPLLLNLYCLF